MKLDKDN